MKAKSSTPMKQKRIAYTLLIILFTDLNITLALNTLRGKDLSVSVRLPLETTDETLRDANVKTDDYIDIPISKADEYTIEREMIRDNVTLSELIDHTALSTYDKSEWWLLAGLVCLAPIFVGLICAASNLIAFETKEGESRYHKWNSTKGIYRGQH